MGLVYEGQPLVDLSTDRDGDRVAIIRGYDVSYEPATRVNIGATHTGAAGYCRYVRRTQNGELYVTGTGLAGKLIHSADGGHSWHSRDLGLPDLWFVSAFTILQDDTFLLVEMPNLEGREVFLHRSTDYGENWRREKLALDLTPHSHISGWNSDAIQLQDGTLLLTFELKNSKDAIHQEDGTDLPAVMKGAFPYVLRSHDGGATWPEKSMVSLYGAEVHLLELPSGRILAAIRKQRWHRLPGDPHEMEPTMRANGYRPEYTGFVEDTAFATTSCYKSVYVSESSDGGRTWVDERRVSDYEQCSGDLALLADGKTLVLAYDSRYPDRFGKAGVRARVSYDQGQSWEPVEYVLGEGENYPGCIATPDGGLITVCP